MTLKLASEYYHKGEVDIAHQYASEFPNDEPCATIIKSFLKGKPNNLEHSQSNEILISSSKEINDVDFTISLFKSAQEYLFYKAVREVYQSYMVFPNVSLNALIDFNQISGFLSTQERSYFFKALVDCVVIDQENNYKPIKFIELDSVFHDNEQSKKNDLMKNNIIEKSGNVLYRVRPQKKVINEQEFIKLIREVII